MIVSNALLCYLLITVRQVSHLNVYAWGISHGEYFFE